MPGLPMVYVHDAPMTGNEKKSRTKVLRQNKAVEKPNRLLCCLTENAYHNLIATFVLPFVKSQLLE
jgi:hypothetical protein